MPWEILGFNLVKCGGEYSNNVSAPDKVVSVRSSSLDYYTLEENNSNENGN